MFRPFIAANSEITLNNFLLLLECVCNVPFEIWIAIVKKRDFWKS